MQPHDFLKELSEQGKSLFQNQQSLLTFEGYLEQLRAKPRELVRNAPAYMLDMFAHFGSRSAEEPFIAETAKTRATDENSSERPEQPTATLRGQTYHLERKPQIRYTLFDLPGSRSGPIVRGEGVQNHIHGALQGFVRQGYANKLLLLHGPNGSSKSSTVDAIAQAMEEYSRTQTGVVYTFNWIFPTDKHAALKPKGDGGPIGFGYRENGQGMTKSYALLDESQVACKIPSEFRDNPVFLIPKETRIQWLREWFAAEQGINPDEVRLPPHVELAGLSKRNQQILDSLLSVYEGDLGKVLRHVQVERFFYSRQYRVGISTIEPQMSIDAVEKQLTMDRNISNIPTVLQNIRLHEAFGQLVEANRGLLEFADMLKRPLEAFKYLLNCIETSSLNLQTSTAMLDVVFFGTTNEKHLDAFKTVPDFTSFRERFELITVPYLLNPIDEERIYARDISILEQSIKVAPHTLELLCNWAVMTRMKKPDPEIYEAKDRPLIARINPKDKVHLLAGRPLGPAFSSKDVQTLRELKPKIESESQGMVVYEGRFGASPREVRAILYRAAQNPEHRTLTPMAIFAELRRVIKDRTVYEFLQFEPRGRYHDVEHFINDIQEDFASIFEYELLMAMSLVAEGEYTSLLRRYVENVVAHLKKEKIRNSSTGEYEWASERFMLDVEKLLGATEVKERFREDLMNRLASAKLEYPDQTIEVDVVFADLLKRIQGHYYDNKKRQIERNYEVMIMLEKDGTEENGKVSASGKQSSKEDLKLAEETFANLESRFGYDRISAFESLKFLMNFRK